MPVDPGAGEIPALPSWISPTLRFSGGNAKAWQPALAGSVQLSPGARIRIPVFQLRMALLLPFCRTWIRTLPTPIPN
jgi:hypothetical protein